MPYATDSGIRRGVEIFTAHDGAVTKRTANIHPNGDAYTSQRQSWSVYWENRADAEAAAIEQIHAMIDAKEAELVALRNELVKATKRLAKLTAEKK